MYKLQNAFPFDIRNSHEKYAEYIYIYIYIYICIYLSETILREKFPVLRMPGVYRMSRSKVKIDVGRF